MSVGKIVLDIDGVMANFEKRFCERFGYDNRDKFCLEERYPNKTDAIYNFSITSATYESLEVLEIGQKIARWAKNLDYEIYIVSSRPDYAVSVTGNWLKFHEIPFHFLSVSSEWKSPKVHRIRNINPLFAVDDSLSVCRQLSYYDIPSFLVDSPWNQSEEREYGILYRIKDFYDFLGIIDRYFDI